MWLAVGVNPGAMLWEVVLEWVERFDPSTPVLFLLALVPLALLVGMVVLIFKKGGWLGSLAVVLGFVAGLQVVSAPPTSLLLLLAAAALGYVATK